jgi:hypothetical protein
MKATFDHGVFQEVLDMRAGHKKGAHAMEALFERYLGAVQSVAEAVDKL